jgi:hypothetical protein
MRLKKNRILKRKELIQVLLKLKVKLPEKQDPDSLFTALLDEAGKPPFPPPPGTQE